ncbi:MAG: hypothetical protein COV63_00085 [Candidatus Nealsonbacteria bacterium CG11_big_fil_rev_8_21_14_0_20_37_68]|nr:MAG: hypothetical protein COV63_00085 [Candidatus Nealsonbacteria bacterium CG11_big_fil_rev_8_21_14_0_20_37_68]PIW91958.1 MAG: hypothetical protein COZ89_02435 [Candidatus Nealsonbacteria bacterium CG_4_8_14_3_um_filter_37_23]
MINVKSKEENMNKKNKNLTSGDIEKLLSEQTLVILSAVDEKLKKIEYRIEKMEYHINQNINGLTTTLDNFLKRMTDMEDEFEILKHDLKKVKEVIKEKLGVDLNL